MITIYLKLEYHPSPTLLIFKTKSAITWWKTTVSKLLSEIEVVIEEDSILIQTKTKTNPNPKITKTQALTSISEAGPNK